MAEREIKFNPEVAKIDENTVEALANQVIENWTACINLDNLTDKNGKVNEQEKQRIINELKKYYNKTSDNIRRIYEGSTEDPYGNSHAMALANLVLDKLVAKHIPDNIAPELDDEVKEEVRTVLSQIGGPLEKK